MGNTNIEPYPLPWKWVSENRIEIPTVFGTYAIDARGDFGCTLIDQNSNVVLGFTAIEYAYAHLVALVKKRAQTAPFFIEHLSMGTTEVPPSKSKKK